MASLLSFWGAMSGNHPRERELVNSFPQSPRQIPVINRDEIDEGRFWSLQEIRNNLGKEIFTPNFEHEFKMFFSNPSSKKSLREV